MLTFIRLVEPDERCYCTFSSKTTDWPKARLTEPKERERESVSLVLGPFVLEGPIQGVEEWQDTDGAALVVVSLVVVVGMEEGSQHG